MADTVKQSDKNNIKTFLSRITGDPRLAINFPFLWGVTITGVSPITINGILDVADEKWIASISPNTYTNFDGMENILVAQSVSLPSEASDFTAAEFGTGMGGFLPTYGLLARNNFLSRSFSVNFLETQHDIEHNFFRPWLIALSIMGLIEGGGPSLKGTMHVKQYNNQGKVMKEYIFNKMFPTAIESFTLNYEAGDFIVKSVTFACENYTSYLKGSDPNATHFASAWDMLGASEPEKPDFVGDVPNNFGNMA